MTSHDVTDQRCATQMHDAGVDPIGSAGSYAGYLLTEWALPWPSDLSEVEELSPVRDALRDRGAGVRLQGLVPTDADRRRMIHYRRPDGPFTRYVGHEMDASGSARADGDRPGTGAEEAGRRLGEAAVALLAGSGLADGDTPTRTRDVLICTHGRRDRCCGSFGTQLWHGLAADPAALGGDVRLWRTSHTGGHRYAATMIILPEGTVWGFADVASALRVIRREGPAHEVLNGYRGCAGLPSPAAQALERAVIETVGWSVLDMERTVDDLGDGRVALTLGGDDGSQRWEATVAPGREVPLPECGVLPVAGARVLTEQRVTDVTRVA